jgi:hypothetical protein
MKKLADYKFIDIHYHASPDLYNRRFHALQAGEIYQSLQGAVVLKSHLGSTSVQATLAQAEGLPVFPSVVLNAVAGGIDYRVIMRSLLEFQPQVASKLLVHFPTITNRKYQSKLVRHLSHSYLSTCSLQGETLFDDCQRLRKEVIDILKMANDYPIVLSTGHASKDETYRLIDACLKYKVKALLLNQPANPLTDLKAWELVEILANEFVWVEQTLLTYVLGHQEKEDFKKVLTSLSRVIYSSDLGQTSQMDIISWVEYSEKIFAEFGLSASRQEDIVRNNALQLLCVDPPSIHC